MADSINLDDIGRMEFLSPDMVIVHEIECQMGVPATIGKPITEDLHAFLAFHGARRAGTNNPRIVHVAVPYSMVKSLAEALQNSLEEAEEYRVKLEKARENTQWPSSEKPQGE